MKTKLNALFCFCKRVTILLLLLSSAYAQEQAGEPSAMESTIPAAYPLDRYEYIWEKSPFTLSSAAEVPVSNTFNNLVLVGLGAINQQLYARILDKASQKRFTVTKDTPYDGILLVSISPDADPESSSAVLRKGSEEGKISFDPAMLMAAAPVPNQAQLNAQQRAQQQANQKKQQAVNQRQPQANNPNQQIPKPRAPRRRIVIPSSR